MFDFVYQKRPAPKVELQKPSTEPGFDSLRKAANPSRTAASFFAGFLRKESFPRIRKAQGRDDYGRIIALIWVRSALAFCDPLILIERDIPAKGFRDEDQALLEPFTDSHDAKRFGKIFFRDV